MRPAALLLTALLAAPLGAETPVDQRRPAALDGLVDIENMAGSIRVTGWDKAEIVVSGRLGRAATISAGVPVRRSRFEPRLRSWRGSARQGSASGARQPDSSHLPPPRDARPMTTGRRAPQACHGHKSSPSERGS